MPERKGLLDLPGFKTSPELFKAPKRKSLGLVGAIGSKTGVDAAAVIASGTAKREAGLARIEREGSDVDQANLSATAHVGQPLDKTGKAILGGIGMIPGFSLGTGFTSAMDALGFRGVISDATTPRVGSDAFSSVVGAGEQASGAEGFETAADEEEAFLGDIMRAFESDGGSTIGDIGGSRVDDSGLSGARDDIGTREGGDRDRDGPDSSGGFGGDDGFGGPSFHKGGPITDRNPKTFQNNMRITAQEGEFVMSREAVGLLSPGFFARINQAARKRKR